MPHWLTLSSVTAGQCVQHRQAIHCAQLVQLTLTMEISLVADCKIKGAVQNYTIKCKIKRAVQNYMIKCKIKRAVQNKTSLETECKIKRTVQNKICLVIKSKIKGEVQNKISLQIECKIKGAKIFISISSSCWIKCVTVNPFPAIDHVSLEQFPVGYGLKGRS